jgi:hypothetical protein
MQTSLGVARVLNPARVVLKAPRRSLLLLRLPPSSSSSLSSSTNYRRARIAVRKSANMTGASITHRSKPSPSSSLLLRQLFEKDSSTYTYLLADVGHPDRPAVVSRSALLSPSTWLITQCCIGRSMRFSFDFVLAPSEAPC